MAEAAGGDSEPDTVDEIEADGETEEDSKVKAKRRVNRTALAIGAAMVVAVGLAVFGTFYFIEGERQREVQAWQVRLGIVADGRAAAVNGWVEQNFSHVRELAENASLQLYMSELALGGGEPELGAKGEKNDPADAEEEAGRELADLVVVNADLAIAVDSVESFIGETRHQRSKS